MAEIVLMRHGHAFSAQRAGAQPDSERPLSPLGEAEARETARHLNAAGFFPNLIISSPFLRADRTASIAAELFTGAERKKAAEISDGPLQALLELILGTFPEDSRVLMVGHQPLLGAAAGFLLGMDGFDLSPAGFVRLNSGKGPGAGSLIEYYTPPPPEDTNR